MTKRNDIEAQTSNSSGASTSVSTTLELPQLNVQPRSRLKGEEKKNPEPESAGRDLFRKLRGGLKGSQRCLFICWESSINDQRVVLVPVKDPKDEKKIYEDMRQKLYESCGWWWKYIPFYGVRRLEEIEVCKRSTNI